MLEIMIAILLGLASQGQPTASSTSSDPITVSPGGTGGDTGQTPPR